MLCKQVSENFDYNINIDGHNFCFKAFIKYNRIIFFDLTDERNCENWWMNYNSSLHTAQFTSIIFFLHKYILNMFSNATSLIFAKFCPVIQIVILLL